VLLSTAAHAEPPEWQEYREEELGFRIEMRRGLSFKKETAPEDATYIVRWTTAEDRFDGMTLFVLASEYRDPVPAKDIYEYLREGGPATGFTPDREEARMVSGVPAREFIREADDISYINLAVVVDNRVIFIFVHGDRSIHGNPAGRRFLDSLALLRGGR